MFQNRTSRLAMLSAGIVIVSGLFAFYAWRETRATSHSHKDMTSRSEEAVNDLEVELVTLRPFGCEPSVIERFKGPFVLMVDDRTGKATSSLTLQHVQGQRVRDLQTDRRKSERYAVIDLPPGNYLLTDAANADARCQIRILP